MNSYINIPVGAKHVLMAGSGQLSELLGKVYSTMEVSTNFSEMLLNWNLVRQPKEGFVDIRYMLELNQRNITEFGSATLSIIDQLDNHIEKQANHIAGGDSIEWSPAVRIGGSGLAEASESTLADMMQSQQTVSKTVAQLLGTIEHRNSTRDYVSAALDDIADEIDVLDQMAERYKLMHKDDLADAILVCTGHAMAHCELLTACAKANWPASTSHGLHSTLTAVQENIKQIGILLA